MDTSFLTAAVVLLPLLAALVLWLLRHGGDGLGDGLVCLVAAVELVLTVLLRITGGTADLEGILHSGLHFAAGYESLPAIVAALALLLVVLVCPAGSEVGDRAPRLRSALLVGLSGLMGVFYASDFMTLYLFLMVLSLASCIWVAHPETGASRKAADTCLAVTMISGLTLLYGLFLLHHHFGSLSYEMLGKAEGAVGLLPAVCLLMGFGARAAAFPLHVWLPGAADHGYSGCGALFSGAVAAAGLHGILMEVTYLQLPQSFASLLLALGLATLIFGGLCAVYSTGLKRLLVWLAVAQSGLVLMAAPFYVVHMAAAKCHVIMVTMVLAVTALFILAHVLEAEKGTDDLNALKGAAQGNKLLTLLFALPALSLVGFPGLAGHVSLSTLHEAVTQPGIPAGLADLAQAALPLLFIGLGLTAAALLKVFLKVFVQPRKGAAAKAGKEAGVSLVVLSVLLLALGLLPEPGFTALLGEYALSFRFTGVAILTEAIVLVCGLILWAVIVRYLRTDKATGDYVPSQSLFSLEDDVFGNLLKALAFVGALLGRLCYSVTELVVHVCSKLLNLGNKKWDPGRDPHFSHYSKGYVRMNPILTTLSFELLLFGLGVVAVFIYLLF